MIEGIEIVVMVAAAVGLRVEVEKCGRYSLS
jgi:hypothetical protein